MHTFKELLSFFDRNTDHILTLLERKPWSLEAKQDEIMIEISHLSPQQGY